MLFCGIACIFDFICFLNTPARKCIRIETYETVMFISLFLLHFDHFVFNLLYFKNDVSEMPRLFFLQFTAMQVRVHEMTYGLSTMSDFTFKGFFV